MADLIVRPSLSHKSAMPSRIEGLKTLISRRSDRRPVSATGLRLRSGYG